MTSPGSADTTPRITLYGYDPESGRLASVTNGEGESVSYAYDRLGNLTTITDGAAHIMQYEYDDLNRQTARTAAFGTLQALREEYAYNAAGNLTQQRVPNGSGGFLNNDFTYDALNRLATARYFDMPTGSPISYTYTLDGQLASVSDPQALGSTSYAYDTQGRYLLLSNQQSLISSITLIRQGIMEQMAAETPAVGQTYLANQQSLRRTLAS